MKPIDAAGTFGAAFVIALAAPTAARASGGCSSDSFAARGTTLTVELCALAGSTRAAKSEIVTETVSAKGQTPIVRRVTIEAPVGDETARTIDDAPLGSLGIPGTLHVTIAFRSGVAHLEHALLVPGAIPLK